MPPKVVQVCAVNLTLINAPPVLLGVNKDHVGMG